ncbi:MAG: NAD(P)/FAD-dependent oxidoreductase [Bacteroidales bacterium]|jgi:phytoene dehydrogenase-like protein|nr:NAD(P)/FAD-dependent oxidoreductase [Bacteroidales bacterium]
MKYDIIIIGGGLGGLTAGAKLSREGKKVLLIEQHDRPGGCATTFKRGDYTMEVGLHEMDGPSPSDIKTKLFNELDVFKNVTFLEIPEFYHFISGRTEITIPHNPEKASEILKEAYPQEKEGIDAFYSYLLFPKKRIIEPDAPKDRSLGEFLDSIIKNEELKLVLLGNLGYFHDDPYSISLGYYSAAQVRYLNNGASFIKGGSQHLSNHLAAYIKEHGGEVVLNHMATGLIIEDGKLLGIKYSKKIVSDNETLEAFGDEIIVNSSLPGLVELLPDKEGAILKNEIGSQQPGASLLTVYFGFKNSLKNLGHHHYCLFIYDESVKTQKDILENNRGDYKKRNFTFIDYGQVDSALAPEGKSTGAVCCTDYLADWENLNAEEYKSKKEEVAKIFLSRLEKIIPGITGATDYYEVGTPKTVKCYTLNPAGAVYGFEQKPFKQQVDTNKIFDNLHVASAWGKTGGGFSGAIYAGYMCAINIMRKKPVIKG